VSEVRQESPQRFIRNADKLCDLLLEMTILVDIGPDLILPTTLLEGDDFLLPFVMAEVRTLTLHVRFDQVLANPRACENLTHAAQKLASLAHGKRPQTAAFASSCSES
jgi:hypothetical protein